MAVALFLLLAAGLLHAGNQVVPGELLIDPPTLENLGFRWVIEGDDNRNAAVAVSYRKKGEKQWRPGHPMLRVHGEVANQDYEPHKTPNLFAGSVLFLQPTTTYEVRFVMTDPDGGAAPPRTLTISTRAEPKAFAKGRKIHLRPGGDLAAAYRSARPGDVLLLHAGVYKLPATLVLDRSGAPGMPIVFRGAGDGEAILEGAGHKTDLLNIQRADHLLFEDLTLRHASHAILAGRKNEPGASYLTVRRCKIEDVIYGISTYSENSSYWYIADNTLTGINPTWYPRPEVGYMSPSHTGINLYGQGNVACYNRISRFSDGIAPANFGPPVADPRKHTVSIDIYGNDVSFAQDDPIETDYGAHNFRVYRNRLYNAHTGISVQPFYGGPVYLIRNEIYGVTALTFKLHNYCAGIEAYHNTAVAAGSGFQSFDRWQNGHFRNNLLLGGRGYAMMTGTLTPYSTLDHDGFRRNGPGELIRWFDGRVRAVFPSLEEFSRATGHERHGILVGYDIFVNAARLEAGITVEPAGYDLRLKPGSVPVDAGLRLPGINDAFSDRAPDLGCYELGSPQPRYGPRP
jgi:hypothetical protein